MVVIREPENSLLKKFGKNFIPRMVEFSEVVGYTIESEEGEIKVEFNPDRPDLLSFYALNASMKCFYDGMFSSYQEPEGSGIEFRISEDVRSLRKYMTSFVAKGKPLGKKFQDLIDYQERLHDNIGKGRLKVSIGIHDLDKVRPPFEFKAVDSDSAKFTTYDGQVTGTPREILSLHPKGQEFSNLIPSKDEVPLITDFDGHVLSLPPVINGYKSRIDESSSRFFIDITGQDAKATRDAFFLLMYEFSNMGYTPQTVKNYGKAYAELRIEEHYNRRLNISRKEVERILHLNLEQEEVISLLSKMGYSTEVSDGSVYAVIPPNRVDVMGEVDVIEDIAKSYGITNIEEVKMDLPLIGESSTKVDFLSLLRDAMIGIGMQEVRTFVVTSSNFYSEIQYNGGLEVVNPKSLDFSVVRDRLIVNMLELLRINKRRPLPFRIFEIGDVYHGGKQETHLCSLVMDTRAGFSSIKQALDQTARRLGISSLEIKDAQVDGLITGRAGHVILNGQEVGSIGEITPELLVLFDLTAPAAAFEIDVKKVLRSLN